MSNQGCYDIVNDGCTDNNHCQNDELAATSAARLPRNRRLSASRMAVIKSAGRAKLVLYLARSAAFRALCLGHINCLRPSVQYHHRESGQF